MFFKDRDDLIKRGSKELGLKTMLEMGVREGYLSRSVLINTELTLYGIDKDVRDSAKQLEGEFPGRYFLRQGVSPSCASIFADEFFDLIQIDADHSYSAVAADLEAWWPKLGKGIFSGDDYAFTDNPVEGKYGVVEAVNEFADRHGLTLYISGVEGADRDAQIAFARFNGEPASNFLRQRPYRPFQNPAWYILKGY